MRAYMNAADETGSIIDTTELPSPNNIINPPPNTPQTPSITPVLVSADDSEGAGVEGDDEGDDVAGFKARKVLHHKKNVFRYNNRKTFI